MTPALEIIERHGLEEFSTCLTFQEQLVEAKAKDRTLSDFAILVEHEEVYTLGRGSQPQPLLAPIPKTLRWIEIGRGGQATYHGPGQLVCYPIFDLERHGKDVHRFLRKLEQVIIVTLKKFSITGLTRPGLTGVWVESENEIKKIASLGIGVRKWISYHGFALNVSPELSYFRAISPCGQEGRVVTSLAEILASRDKPCPTMGDVKVTLSAALKEVFRFDAPAKRTIVRPPWLKAKAPGSPEYLVTRNIVRELKLVTVCEEARCPNIGECWAHHTATFMIMGDLCTRRCGFCSVKDGTADNLTALNPLEPLRIASAVKQLGLKHVVVTSVNRDDLEDMGAEHFQQTARNVRSLNPDCTIEALIPDMQGRRELLEIILGQGYISILNHNVETVPRLYRRVRPGAHFKKSLNILKWAKEICPNIKTKSGLMVGLGETPFEVGQLMDELRAVGCDILTIGQYLQPTPEQLPVEKFITPAQFEDYRKEGLKRGFLFVESGPFVRSSYHAWKHAPNATTGLGNEPLAV